MYDVLDGRDSTPILDLNTTPLIDVLLVLLVMFIITLPIQTHAVKFEIPSGPPVKTVLPVSNEVSVTAGGQILWNGQQVSASELRSLLLQTQQIDPVPELHLRPQSAARYETVDQVLAIAKRAHVRNMGFVGNEAYANF